MCHFERPGIAILACLVFIIGCTPRNSRFVEKTTPTDLSEPPRAIGLVGKAISDAITSLASNHVAISNPLEISCTQASNAMRFQFSNLDHRDHVNASVVEVVEKPSRRVNVLFANTISNQRRMDGNALVAALDCALLSIENSHKIHTSLPLVIYVGTSAEPERAWGFSFHFTPRERISLFVSTNGAVTFAPSTPLRNF